MNNADLILFVLSGALVFFVLIAYLFMLKKLVFLKDRMAALFHFGYMGFYFLLAPVLHVIYSYRIADVAFEDAISAFYNLNILNGVGLLFAIFGFFISSRVKVLKINSYADDRYLWKRLNKYSLIFLSLSLVYFLVYMWGGGVLFRSFDASSDESLSIVNFIIIESIPMLLSWAIFSWAKNKEKNISFWFYFIIFMVAVLIFSGARGSRVSIALQALSFLLLYHYLIRGILWREVLLLFIGLIVLNNIFSVYKYGGSDAFGSYISTGEKPAYLEQKESKVLSFLLHDLGRADVQAVILEKILINEYKPPMIPSSYLYGALLLVPTQYRPEGISSKRDLGTQAQYNEYGGNGFSSSRIYGLLGEGLLNFGIFAIPFVFMIFGALHYKSINIGAKFRSGAFVLFYPFLFLLPIYMLFYDFDNLIFQTVKVWFIPAFVFFIALSSRRAR